MNEMIENTNDIETTNSDELIFDELNTNDNQEEVTTDTENEVNEVKEETKPTLKVKYNGSEQELSYEDAITYAQKGMNYDKLNQKYETLFNSPELKMISKQAEQMNMTPREYVNYLEQFQIKSLTNKAMKELREQYPDADENLLLQVAQNQVNDYLGEQEYERQLQQQRESETQENQLTNQIERFINEYPDVDIDHLPEEVLQYISQGEDLLSAYRAYEIKLMKDRLNAFEVNSRNKAKAIGNLTDDRKSETNDPFLDGLLGK